MVQAAGLQVQRSCGESQWLEHGGDQPHPDCVGGPEGRVRERGLDLQRILSWKVA